ncbi:MAG: 30S ribosomal protein S2 [Candidatus Omnitrophica bacterium]|nr:30S ribosomal protein S2 [Candidatus Omnitrophota bacterium]
MALPEVIKELLENGVHFGHLSKHWNPRMKKFIFGKKKDVYIIDLEKTAQKLDEAKEFVKEKVANGEKILFVATKKQLRGLIKEIATSCAMPYMVDKWVGGLLTNFPTVRKRIKKYVDFLQKRASGEFDKVPRKAVVRLNRELKRMEKNYSGVSTLEELPQCIFVVDPKKETACVREAVKSSIPIIALIDTDADPTMIDYPVPGNDDAIKSVRYIAGALAQAVREGEQKAKATAAGAKNAQEADGSEPEAVAYEEIEDKVVDKEKDTKATIKKRLRQKDA